MSTSKAFVELLGMLLGLLFGSFLNVCISRLPQHQSIVRPRSRCTACGRPVQWYDNVPVVSWLLLRARCRNCGTAISWRYPAVELAVGLWFATIAGRLWNIWPTLPAAPLPSLEARLISTLVASGIGVLGFLLIGLMVMDWQTQRLPDTFTISGIAAGLFLACVQAVFLGPSENQVILNTTRQLRLSSPGSSAAHGNVLLTGPEALIFVRVAAVASAALLLLIVRWIYKVVRKREGMGLGDVKMLAMIAAFLGFWGSLLSLFIGVLAASLFAIVLVARSRAGAATRLPLGSFLAAGGLVAALFGGRIAAWYAGLLR